MCKAMQRFLVGDPHGNAKGIADADMAAIRNLFQNATDQDGGKRHAQWLTAISDGVFSFGSEAIYYMGKKGKLGEDGLNKSWKEEALGTNADLLYYTYKASFLKSDWKLFHDAVMNHRFYVVDELLPAYGICAA